MIYNHTIFQNAANTEEGSEQWKKGDRSSLVLERDELARVGGDHVSGVLIVLSFNSKENQFVVYKKQLSARE